MAKSGFMPAWMKIPSSDKTNVHQYPTNTSGRQRYHSADLVDNHSLSKLRISNQENLSRSNRLLSTSNNFDQHSELFNSIIEGNKNHVLSSLETSEEKELLKRMGWNDDMTYEITDQDKEEYEKRIQLLPKTDNRSAKLISALNRRALPCLNIQDISQLDKIDSASDDDSSDD